MCCPTAMLLNIQRSMVVRKKCWKDPWVCTCILNLYETDSLYWSCIKSIKAVSGGELENKAELINLCWNNILHSASNGNGINLPWEYKPLGWQVHVSGTRASTSMGLKIPIEAVSGTDSKPKAELSDPWRNNILNFECNTPLDINLIQLETETPKADRNRP